MKRAPEYLIIAALLALLVFVWHHYDTDRQHCIDAGGAYVRGMYGYECIGR